MKIVGCDFHPRWQQGAIFDAETGEVRERKLLNGDGEAERFYRALEAAALIGIEACGNSQWFIELAERLGHVVWVGDAAQIRASCVCRQKTDRRDAGHILRLLMERRFPKLWTPSAEPRDLRQLLIHRHKLVEIWSSTKPDKDSGAHAPPRISVCLTKPSSLSRAARRQRRVARMGHGSSVTFQIPEFLQPPLTAR